ncbi:unnamed protein product [Prorocentrum cordatum]|nr:unnamed protein product [Polarella glacialis]
MIAASAAAFRRLASAAPACRASVSSPGGAQPAVARFVTAGCGPEAYDSMPAWFKRHGDEPTWCLGLAHAESPASGMGRGNLVLEDLDSFKTYLSALDSRRSHAEAAWRAQEAAAVARAQAESARQAAEAADARAAQAVADAQAAEQAVAALQAEVARAKGPGLYSKSMEDSAAAAWRGAPREAQPVVQHGQPGL